MDLIGMDLEQVPDISKGYGKSQAKAIVLCNEIAIPTNYEKKAEIVNRLAKLTRIYKKQQDADLKMEIDELESEINLILEYESKTKIVADLPAVLGVIEDIDETAEFFSNRCRTINKEGKITHHILPSNMINTKDGFLVGIDAIEFKRNIGVLNA